MNWLSLAETYILPELPEPQLIDIVVPLIFALLLIGLVIWLMRILRVTHRQQAAAISFNTEVLQVTKEQIEVSRETNRLLSELNETLRKKADGP